MLRLITRRSHHKIYRLLSTQIQNTENVNPSSQEPKVNLKQGLADKFFHQVADKYDFLNDLMSFGIHRVWKHTTISELGDLNFPGIKVIDVAGGIGDLAYYMCSKSKELDVTVCDINKGMLEAGKERALQLGYGNAENLSQFADNTFDIYTSAFGIRNITDRSKALKEAYRILKPGGRFLSLEFSKVTLPVLAELYSAHRSYVIPWIGYYVAGDYDAYKYLSDSIENFPDQEKFLNMIKEIGFKNCYYRNLSFGIVALHSGIKIH